MNNSETNECYSILLVMNVIVKTLVSLGNLCNNKVGDILHYTSNYNNWPCCIFVHNKLF